MMTAVHPSGWDRFDIQDRAGTVVEQHVIPADDLQPHASSAHCWCRPSEDDVAPDLFVHHSADRRELYEQGLVRLH